MKFSVENTCSDNLDELKAKLSTEQLRQMKSKWASFIRTARELGDTSTVDWTQFKTNMIKQELSFKF